MREKVRLDKAYTSIKLVPHGRGGRAVKAADSRFMNQAGNLLAKLPRGFESRPRRQYSVVLKAVGLVIYCVGWRVSERSALPAFKVLVSMLQTGCTNVSGSVPMPF